MAEYEYTGPGPHEDPELGLVRPGDVHEWDGEPPWGPWRLIEPGPDDGSQDESGGHDAPGGTETPAETPAGQSPALKPEDPPPSGSAPPVTTSAAPAASTEGM